jgi:hypothetical protein
LTSARSQAVHGLAQPSKRPPTVRFSAVFVFSNSADNAIGSRQLMSELDYLYHYDPARHAYVTRVPGAEHGGAVPENRPFLTILQSENDVATGQFFPIGTGLSNVLGLRAHWDRVPVPGTNGQKVSESEFYTHTPGNDRYLVNYHVALLGAASPPPGLKSHENRAFEANLTENHPDYIFYTTTATRIASAVTPYGKRNLAAVAICFYRKRSRTPLDRARTKGDHLGPWRTVE